ncbi:MAG: hypothetical protein DDT32_02014 [Syntrophomonadaceae bacterium]|nr:hypothetical protein [Bacillota bacterium]MBT9148243.1 hypothetical protein [Bacillota bacterium]
MVPQFRGTLQGDLGSRAFGLRDKELSAHGPGAKPAH